MKASAALKNKDDFRECVIVEDISSSDCGSGSGGGEGGGEVAATIDWKWEELLSCSEEEYEKKLKLVKMNFARTRSNLPLVLVRMDRKGKDDWSVRRCEEKVNVYISRSRGRGRDDESRSEWRRRGLV